MNSKLELLLNKINLDKNNYKYFDNGEILKIISSKDKLNWNFIIDVKASSSLPNSSLLLVVSLLPEIKSKFVVSNFPLFWFLTVNPTTS